MNSPNFLQDIQSLFKIPKTVSVHCLIMVAERGYDHWRIFQVFGFAECFAVAFLVISWFGLFTLVYVNCLHYYGYFLMLIILCSRYVSFKIIFKSLFFSRYFLILVVNNFDGPQLLIKELEFFSREKKKRKKK